MKYLFIYRVINFTLLLLFISILYSCAASTGSRYDKNDNNTKHTSEDNEEISNPTALKEDFDITPYKTKINIPEKKWTKKASNQNIWFDYDSPETKIKTKSLVGTADGYRILVLTTDNLEEANQVKADIYFGQTFYEVYVDFEPPFYRVKTGDFDSQKSAEDLRFKLNQLGYKEAKVIRDKINVYK